MRCERKFGESGFDRTQQQISAPCHARRSAARCKSTARRDAQFALVLIDTLSSRMPRKSLKTLGRGPARSIHFRRGVQQQPSQENFASFGRRRRASTPRKLNRAARLDWNSLICARKTQNGNGTAMRTVLQRPEIRRHSGARGTPVAGDAARSARYSRVSRRFDAQWDLMQRPVRWHLKCIGQALEPKRGRVRRAPRRGPITGAQRAQSERMARRIHHRFHRRREQNG